MELGLQFGRPLFPGFEYPTSRKTVLARSSNNGHEFSSNDSLSVKPAKTVPGTPEADVVVIGSGIGGHCCAGLLARYNQDVLVLESHDLPGGTAHSFDIKDYKFDSGLSLFSGFESRGPQANPLAQLLVLDALGESILCAKYDSWTVYIPEGEFLSRIGPTEFFKGLRKDLGIHHIVVNDWDRGVDADQNVVLISVPRVLSLNLAPPGKHVLHAYTPGTEPFELWNGLDRKSAEYKKLKAERSEVTWRAFERALGSGFSREKCEVKLVGTPLTHRRFLQRNRGTYGPAMQAGQDSFPGHSTPIPQLYCCGDSTFPGIGVPAVAASGAIVANSLVSVSQHSQLLDAIGI